MLGIISIFFLIMITSFAYSESTSQQNNSDELIDNIPGWVREGASAWNQELVTDSQFFQNIDYLIKEGVIKIPYGTESYNASDVKIPSWIKKQVGWWTSGIVSDEEFINSIQFLIKTKVIFLPPLIETKQVIETIPTSPGTVVNFYVNDRDLDTSPNGIDEISTEGLIEVTINGEPVSVPSTMIETTPSSGKFFLKVKLPTMIDGRPLSQDDIILIKYLDQSDQAGEQRVVETSIPLSKTFAKIQSGGGSQRIGHEFILRLYEPDANRDSKDEDKIPIRSLEFRAEGGIRTTLANPAFDANSSSLIETGPNSNVFEVEIKIPRTIDGKTIHIGDWYEIRYFDKTTPSNTVEKIIIKGRIG